MCVSNQRRRNCSRRALFPCSSASTQGRGATAAAVMRPISEASAPPPLGKQMSNFGCRRLQVEADDDVQLEAPQTLVAGRAVDAAGRRVQEERHVEVHAEHVERVQALVVQRDPEVSADVAAQKSELLYRTLELLSCQLRALHGQGGHAHEAAGSTRHELGQPIVVLAAESCSLLGRNVVKVRQRIRGQHLEIDAVPVHPLDPRVSIHEGAATIRHVAEVVLADSVPGLAISLSDLGAVGAGGT
mmetsp:Transcript_59457/g.192256  ORF Transcript_59457/g.192256 Transcript_59457/m.192256 type:complete len:244 (-) Transcript_59457:1264-1995(-)